MMSKGLYWEYNPIFVERVEGPLKKIAVTDNDCAPRPSSKTGINHI